MRLTSLVIIFALLPLNALGVEGVYKVFAEFPSNNCPTGTCPLLPGIRGSGYVKAQGTGVAVSTFNGYCWLLTTEHVIGKNPRVDIGGHIYDLSVEHTWDDKKMLEAVLLVKTRIPVSHNLIRLYKMATQEMPEHSRAYMVGFPAGRYSNTQEVSCSIKPRLIETRGPRPNPGISGGALLYDGELHGLVIGYDNQGIGLHQRLDIIGLDIETRFPDLMATARQIREHNQKVPNRQPTPIENKPPPPIVPEPETSSLPPPVITIPKQPPATVPVFPPGTYVPFFPPAKAPVEPPVIPQEGIVSKAEGIIDNIPWMSLLKILGVTAGVGSGSGLGIYAGLAAFRLLKGAFKQRRGHPQDAGFPSQPQTNRGIARDNTEIEQIIGVRQQEQREPLHDAFFGIAFEDEYKTNPDQSLRQAWQTARDRFDNVAPLSSFQQQFTTSSTVKGN